MNSGGGSITLLLDAGEMDALRRLAAEFRADAPIEEVAKAALMSVCHRLVRTGELDASSYRHNLGWRADR